MLQARIHGPGDVRADEVPEPDPGARDVVVRVHACGICGSDLSYIRMGGVAGPGPEPMCLGHEGSGTVEFAGAEVRSVAVGDRVVVRPGTDTPTLAAESLMLADWLKDALDGRKPVGMDRVVVVPVRSGLGPYTEPAKGIQLPERAGIDYQGPSAAQRGPGGIKED